MSGQGAQGPWSILLIQWGVAREGFPEEVSANWDLNKS